MEKRTQLQQRILISTLLSQCIDPTTGDRLVIGAFEKVAKKMLKAGWSKVTWKSVQKVWLNHKMSILYPEKYNLDVTRKKGSGGANKINVEALQQQVKGVKFSDRQTIRSLALAIKVPRSTLHRALQISAQQRAASSIKPHLTPQNKTQRVMYCRSFVEDDKYFGDMMDRVDYDEKWFYITQKRTKYIVVPGEVPPLRTCKHKSHLIKVMCLTAVARPREIAATGEWWDGKIGMWFFITEYTAQRRSRNRLAGTKETKTVKVNREVTVNMIIENLLPAIEEKWPSGSTKRVRIQHDNATPHPPPGTNAAINAKLAEMATRGWDIQFITQPPNLPDCNTLDLAFFRAIQSLQYCTFEWFGCLLKIDSTEVNGDVIRTLMRATRDQEGKYCLPLLDCCSIFVLMFC